MSHQIQSLPPSSSFSSSLVVGLFLQSMCLMMITVKRIVACLPCLLDKQLLYKKNPPNASFQFCTHRQTRLLALTFFALTGLEPMSAYLAFILLFLATIDIFWLFGKIVSDSQNAQEGKFKSCFSLVPV